MKAGSGFFTMVPCLFLAALLLMVRPANAALLRKSKRVMAAQTNDDCRDDWDTWEPTVPPFLKHLICNFPDEDDINFYKTISRKSRYRADMPETSFSLPVNVDDYYPSYLMKGFYVGKNESLRGPPPSLEKKWASPYGAAQANKSIQMWCDKSNPNTFRPELLQEGFEPNDGPALKRSSVWEDWIAAPHIQEEGRRPPSPARNLVDREKGFLTAQQVSLFRSMRNGVEIELGGMVQVTKDDGVAAAAFTWGDDKSVELNRKINITWHTHPPSLNDRCASPPSEEDLYETLNAQKEGTRTDNIVFALEGTYVYRASEALVECCKDVDTCRACQELEGSSYLQDLRKLLGFKKDPNDEYSGWAHPQLSLEAWRYYITLAGFGKFLPFLFFLFVAFEQI